MTLLQSTLSFVETKEKEPRPQSPPEGYVWMKELPKKIECKTRWHIALAAAVVVVGAL